MKEKNKYYLSKNSNELIPMDYVIYSQISVISSLHCRSFLWQQIKTDAETPGGHYIEVGPKLEVSIIFLTSEKVEIF